jgi:hypothetical protein
VVVQRYSLGKPKRFRQTVDFMLTDENDGKQWCRNVPFLITFECGKFRDTVDCSSKLLACKNDITYHI